MFVTVPEAGQLIKGYSRSQSYANAAKGLIPTVKFGNRILVPVEQLKALVEQKG